jgi:hypothetical protein
MRQHEQLLGHGSTGYMAGDTGAQFLAQLRATKWTLVRWAIIFKLGHDAHMNIIKYNIIKIMSTFWSSTLRLMPPQFNERVGK